MEVRSGAVEMLVLGPVELTDGTSVVRLPRAERTLLAALASRVGERVAVDVLEEALWPQNPPPSARKTLQVYVVRLRRVVGASAIVERAGGYVLDPDLVGIDAARVAAILGEAREAVRSSDPEAAIRLLAAASAAFRGEPYESVPDAALPAGEIARLQELRATVVEEAVEAELVCGRGHQRVGELEAFVQTNPYRERAWSLLMRALYQAGRPADALAAYGRARVVLAAELGIEPGPALRDVEQAILTHDQRLHSMAPASVGLGASNLPAAVSPIIGRDLELAALDLLDLADRLVTLVGAGGIGKTRLAIEVAAQTLGRCQFGPFFVDLAPVGDVGLVPAGLAAALAVGVEPGADAMAAVLAALGHYRVVVVVDNCEHLLPGIAELVGALLASSPGIRVVATSREPLGVAGERICPVDPLRFPPAVASIDQIVGSDAAALFLARLPMSLASGPLSSDELAAVGAICRSLEGIPLGLELAAARSRTLSLPELADRLGRSIDELAPSRHGALPRHRTMRAALDWGYALLTTTAQTALQAMSVFAGGCDEAAFSAVCIDDEDPTTVDVLDELVRTSFATVELTGARTRYRLLEPIRQHACQLLGDNDADRHRRHLDFYVALARNHTSDIDEPGVDTHFDVLTPEFGNFRAALDWAAANPDGTEAGLWLVARLNQLWTSAAHHAEGLSRTVGLLGGGGSAAARSEAAYCAGFIAFDMGDIKQSDELFERALTEAQIGGDRVGEVRARRVLSECAVNAGDIATSRRHLETAIPIAIEEGNDLLHAHCVAALAQLLCATGELDEAEERIRGLLDGTDDSVSSVDIWAQGELGRVMFERGDYTRARACNVRVLDLFGSEPCLNLVLHTHFDLAKIECAAGNLDAAAANIARAAELLPETSRGWDQPFAIAQADLALLRGDWAEALAHAEQADALTDPTVDAFVQCDILRILGDTQLALDRPDDALATFEQLIDFTGASFSCRRAEGHEGAAAAAAALDRPQDAHDHLTTATEIRQRTGSERIRRSIVEQYLLHLESGRQPSRQLYC
jgi:predicted ATPase/DNA-binding SARP family transcriptional activator